MSITLTDSGGLPDHFGWADHKELEVFVRLGMSAVASPRRGDKPFGRTRRRNDLGTICRRDAD
jgi:hypothetical protein